MSGFEIAGAVLGGLPLLIEGVKAAQFYFQGLDRWWEFRRDFEAFSRAMEFEEVIFVQNLDILLTPLELSDNEYRSLRHSQTSNLWHHEDVVSKPRLHLGEALPHFTKMLTELNRDLNELYKLLPIENGKVRFPASHTIDSERLKLCISFSRKRLPLCDKIHTTNERLGQIARNASIIEMTRAPPTSSSRTPSSSTYASSFITLQKQSRTLYGAFKSKFNCSCNDQHRCGISALWDRSRRDKVGPSLNFLINDHLGRKQVSWEVEAIDLAEPLMPTHEQHSLDQIYELDLQANLLRQTNESSKAAQDYRPAALALPSFTAVTSPSDTKTENTRADWAKGLGRPVERLKTAIKGASSAFSRGTPATHMQTAQVHVAQSTQKQVRIVDSTPRPAPTTAKPGITNICSFIRAPSTTNKFLGTLEADYHDIKLYLEPQSQRQLLRAQNETIEAFWCSTVDLSSRLGVGLSIAVTLLALGTSAWIPRCWSQKDVFLMRCSQGSSRHTPTFGPYLDHSSLSFTLSEEPMGAHNHAVLTMFSLGVLLLELYYRKPLESSPHWDRHCPNGLRNEYTDMAAAQEWYEDLAEDPALEEGLAEPIRRCIEASFSTSVDMEDKEFLRDVLETIIQTLEEFISMWSGRRVYN
ncbi:hypothetical protein ACHAPU_009573 [Fusarium lateritium]